MNHTEWKQELEELIGKYWSLAYQEGKTGTSLGDKANKVLVKIHKLMNELPAAQEQLPVMTLRDYFAAHCPEPFQDNRGWDEEANVRYSYADAMLERSKK